MSKNGLPLVPFKVLDLTRVRSGPTCVKVLADWGADVIKIEQPPKPGQDDGYTGSRTSADFQNLHRNKRSMTLNLKEEEGKEIFFRLLQNADVVVENYRPNVKKRLGIDFDTLKKRNPRIILGSISGFGQDGPYANRPGVDQIAQGMGGFMSVTGLPGQGPVRAGTAIADLTCGMNCAIGILIALLQREQTGEGQWVHTSLLESQIALMDFQMARYLIENDVPPQAGNNHPKSTPTGVFKTKNGHINIAAGGQQMWIRLCDGLTAKNLFDNPDYKTAADRLAHRDQLNSDLEQYTILRSSEEWVELLNEKGVPCGPIYKVNETFSDPQVKHLGIARSFQHPKRGKMTVVGQPFQLSGSDPEIRNSTPECGEHTDAILRDNGFEQSMIDKFRTQGVI